MCSSFPRKPNIVYQPMHAIKNLVILFYLFVLYICECACVCWGGGGGGGGGGAGGGGGGVNVVLLDPVMGDGYEAIEPAHTVESLTQFCECCIVGPTDGRWLWSHGSSTHRGVPYPRDT